MRRARILMNGSTVKSHISLKMVFGYSATQRVTFRSCSWFINEFFLKLASSTSMRPSRQEIDHPTSSSSSSTSPTMTSSTVSSDSVDKQERGDLCGIDSYPVMESRKHVEVPRSGTVRPVKFRHTRVAARFQRHFGG